MTGNNRQSSEKTLKWICSCIENIMSSIHYAPNLRKNMVNVSTYTPAFACSTSINRISTKANVAFLISAKIDSDLFWKWLFCFSSYNMTAAIVLQFACHQNDWKAIWANGVRCIGLSIKLIKQMLFPSNHTECSLTYWKHQI